MEEFEKKKYLGTGLRYPLFFIGVMLMGVAGNLYKFTSFPLAGIQVMVGLGFAVFVISMLPGSRKK